ncbi:type III PLP-dependent enzyme [Mariprofundus erugo]|uniref:ornithine decarboxylase n=1 Tax=Mariprofundus erugo TaxID=2528639 RepID=A0A5R9GPQ0_9PROT|nr:type III PLP-dependent enzyme [Mariprofundus erugo]TLS66929.1 type III PLP-dependent enzyme [Mariprofundus erugo]TLS77371.1 type III PLP-dependent enzyme [Mariprofundus erugo]
MQSDTVLIEDYYNSEDFAAIKNFADGKETPFVVINNNIILHHYNELTDNFPYAKIYYAIKANPGNEILSLLRDRGSNFDVASIYELDKVLNLGVSPDRCSYGNTIKKRKDIRYFYEKGVRLFVSDSEADLRNIAREAPGVKVYIRLLTEGSHTADWPLSRKFGCQTDMAVELLLLAKELGLVPYGVSFHVGSQQRDIGAWDAAIDKVKAIFDWLRDECDIRLKMINMGGGFPANYLNRTNDLATYAKEITHYLEDDFGDDMPEIILEPGRSLCSNAGVLVSEIVLISRKTATSLHRWVYTDVGMFSGLIETLGEAIKYPIFVEKSGEREECVIAGPTCDSADIMYEDHKYELPLSIEIGDRLYWFSTGAYTTSYSAVEFNGFPPLKQYVIGAGTDQA